MGVCATCKGAMGVLTRLERVGPRSEGGDFFSGTGVAGTMRRVSPPPERTLSSTGAACLAIDSGGFRDE